MGPEARQLAQVFFPYELDARDRVANANARFVHYTTAEVAMSIIRNKAVWMRNAKTMNDFAEVEHGKDCLFPAYQASDCGGRLRAFVDDLYPGLSGEVEAEFNGWLPHFEQDTYLTCLSEHDAAEDNLGRLSMWRAYGGSNGVALVLNNAPFMAETNDLNAYSSAVVYADKGQFFQKFNDAIDLIISNRDYVQSLGRDMLRATLFMMLRSSILCTKHPGFAEEREWRIIHGPTLMPSKAIEAHFECIRGVPQLVYKIPLKHAPEEGLHHADIPALLDRVIIGPTAFPMTIYKTFVALLAAEGVPDPHSKVWVSDIPLRI